MTRSILIAEDDKFLRRAVEVALKKRGHTVLLAADGQEAIDQARAHKPALLLLDLLMPKKTGIEVLEIMRADPELREITVLILSNSSKELEMHSAEKLGAAGYWIKANLSLQELCDRVARFVPEPTP